ncbi:hypothetical protein [Roseomonas gilardii]|uniref:hypothetical protein n=1 Tax=Roseomonas gilardii TaxID=257708 RepID=UPI0011A10F82|nr:hypothetical protein [Roseomonas gilardii]
MLSFIVDWIGRSWGAAETVEVESTDTFSNVAESAGLTRSEMGIRFQRHEFGRLLKAIGHWESIEIMTAYGSIVDTIDDVPAGADGGIDAVIRITTASERGAKNVAARIRKMITHQSY